MPRLARSPSRAVPSRPGPHCALGPLVALGVLSLGSFARASGPLGPQGSAIGTSAYAIDFFQGPVLASTRITGLAGATAAIAEGVDGMYSNPAAPAVRTPWSYSSNDYDLSAGLTLPSALADTDFDNNGTRGFAYRRFYFLNAGATFQSGPFGFGATIDVSTYQLNDESAPVARALSVNFGRFRLAAAYAFARNQLVVGVGARTGVLQLNTSGENARELAALDAGAGLEAGAVYGPLALPSLRFALAVRSAVATGLDPADDNVKPDAQGDRVVDGLYLPQKVIRPWEAEAGVAWQIGERPLNLAWDDPDAEARALVSAVRAAQDTRRARGEPDDPARRAAEEELVRRSRDAVKVIRRGSYERLSRRRLLLLASVLVSGPSRRAVGVESFLRQTVDRSGERVVVTPRAALEFEPSTEAVKLRAGTYLEPTRFRQGSPRVHGTAGVELRVFPWTGFGLWDEGTYWRVSGFADGARGYFSFGFSVGVWH